MTHWVVFTHGVGIGRDKQKYSLPGTGHRSSSPTYMEWVLSFSKWFPSYIPFCPCNSSVRRYPQIHITQPWKIPPNTLVQDIYVLQICHKKAPILPIIPDLKWIHTCYVFKWVKIWEPVSIQILLALIHSKYPMTKNNEQIWICLPPLHEDVLPEFHCGFGVWMTIHCHWSVPLFIQTSRPGISSPKF